MDHAPTIHPLTAARRLARKLCEAVEAMDGPQALTDAVEAVHVALVSGDTGAAERHLLIAQEETEKTRLPRTSRGWLAWAIAQVLRAVQEASRGRSVEPAGRPLLDIEMDPLPAADAPAPLPSEIAALLLLLPDEVLRLHEEAKRARLAFLRDPRPATEEACFAAEIAAGDCYRGAPYLAQEVKRLRASTIPLDCGLATGRCGTCLECHARLFRAAQEHREELAGEVERLRGERDRAFAEIRKQVAGSHVAFDLEIVVAAQGQDLP